MGRTYSVPRNVKGETRLLYIFTMKSFLTTAIFGLLGFLISLILSGFGLAIVGWIVFAIMAALGYGIGTLTIPDSKFVGVLRKAGGEKLSDIIIRTITFKKRKKIYVYRCGGKK